MRHVDYLRLFLSSLPNFNYIYRHSTAPQLSIENGLSVENIQYSYKIYNNGPSTIKELNLAIQIPTVYIPTPNYHVPIVDFNQISVRGFYINKIYDVTWSRDNKILQQAVEESTVNVIAVDNMNMNFDSSKLGYDYDFNSNRQEEQDLAHGNHRRRRSIWQNNGDDENIFRVYNQYTGGIDEYHSSYRVSSDKEDQTLKNLPKNRTIYLDCLTSEEMDECIEAQFTIHNFRPGSEPININLNFSIDLAKVGTFKVGRIKLTLKITFNNLQTKFSTNVKTFSCTKRIRSFNVEVMKT